VNHSTAITEPAGIASSTGDAVPLFTQRFVLHDVPREAYEALLAAMPERRWRHTYNKGRLEMMSPSMFHDGLKSLLGRLIEAMALELDVSIKSVGSTTFHPPGADHGLEGDEMYFIAHESEMRGKDDYDPANDPPPDLAVEVDITSSSNQRLPIYAALGVAEIWRYDGHAMQFLRLADAGHYEVIELSLSFPFLAPNAVDRIIAQRRDRDENSLVREFLAWVRSQKGG
jgi:Uma2 family endonuclease